MVATDFSHLQFHAVRLKKKLAVLDSCVIVDITWFLLTGIKWCHSRNRSAGCYRRCYMVSRRDRYMYFHGISVIVTKIESLEFGGPLILNKKIFSVRKMRNHWKKLFENITSGIRTPCLALIYFLYQVFYLGNRCSSLVFRVTFSTNET